MSSSNSATRSSSWSAGTSMRASSRRCRSRNEKVFVGSSSTKPRGTWPLRVERRQPQAVDACACSRRRSRTRPARAAFPAGPQEHLGRRAQRSRACTAIGLSTRCVALAQASSPKLHTVARRAAVDEAHGELGRLARAEHERRAARRRRRGSAADRPRPRSVAGGPTFVTRRRTTSPLMSSATPIDGRFRSTADARDGPPRRAPRSRPPRTAARAGRTDTRRGRRTSCRRRGPGRPRGSGRCDRRPCRTRRRARRPCASTSTYAVVISADLSAAGDQVRMRFLEQRRDARDLGRRLRGAGHVLEASRRAGRSRRRASGPPRMSTPGAVTSGFTKFESESDGPRDEKSATMLGLPGTEAKMPRASRTVTSSSSVSKSSSVASAARRSTSTCPSSLPIMTAGMSDAARIAVHDDRRPGVVVDDDGDRAGVLRIRDLDLELAAAALDERDAAVDLGRVHERSARVAGAACRRAARVRRRRRRRRRAAPRSDRRASTAA